MLRLELKYFVATKTRSGIKLNSAEYVAFEQLTRALCMSIFGFAVNVSRVRNKQYRFCTTGERSWFYDFLWFNLAETGQWQTCKKFGFRILRSRRSKQKVISIRFSRSYTVYTHLNQNNAFEVLTIDARSRFSEFANNILHERNGGGRHSLHICFWYMTLRNSLWVHLNCCSYHSCTEVNPLPLHEK